MADEQGIEALTDPEADAIRAALADGVTAVAKWSGIDPTPCCPDPECPGRGSNPCTFPGYADNH